VNEEEEGFEMSMAREESPVMWLVIESSQIPADENDDHYTDAQQGLCEIFREGGKSKGKRQ